MSRETRYAVITTERGVKQVIWHNDDLGKDPLTLKELKSAAKRVFRWVLHKRLIVESDNTTTTLMVDLESNVDGSKKRYSVVRSRDSKSKCLVWYHPDIKVWSLTLAELNVAAKREFPVTFHTKMILQKYDCGIIMRKRYKKFKVRS